MQRYIYLGDGLVTWLCCWWWVYLGAKLGWDEDEELFGRVPVGFGPEGPAISDHHLLKRQLQHRHRRLGVSKLDTACSQALCNWLRLGLAETGVAFNDILFEDENPKIGNGHDQIV